MIYYTLAFRHFSKNDRGSAKRTSGRQPIMVVLMYILAIIIILAATQVAQNLLPRIQSKHLMAYGAVAVYALRSSSSDHGNWQRSSDSREWACLPSVHQPFRSFTWAKHGVNAIPTSPEVQRGGIFGSRLGSTIYRQFITLICQSFILSLSQRPQSIRPSDYCSPIHCHTRLLS